MDTIFLNSENSKIPDRHRLLLSLTDKINLKKSDNYVALLNLSIYYTWFQLPDGLHSVSDIQDYFEYILKKHETVTDNPSIMIYLNKIENRIRFKIKAEYYVEHVTCETMKLLGGTKSKITKDKNRENVPHLESISINTL